MGKLTLSRGASAVTTTAITTLIVLVALFPILWAVLNSFKELMDIVTPVPRFFFSPTLANYKQVLASPEVLTGLGNSVAIVGVAVLLPRVSAAFIWKFMYSPLMGILNWLLECVGLGGTALLSDPATALYAVALVDIWQWGLFFGAVILKLLETLPGEPLEAARLDYASTLQVYAYIALPMLKVPIMSLVFIKMVESLRSFDLIYVMTKGGPGISTETLDMYAYAQGIGLMGKVSYASSMAVLMMLATTVIFTLLWKRVAKWEN